MPTHNIRSSFYVNPDYSHFDIFSSDTREADIEVTQDSYLCYCRCCGYVVLMSFEVDLWFKVFFFDSLTSVQVNGIDLRTASHDEAINVLRQTPQQVRLTVFRDEAQYKEDELWDVLSVELQKKPGQGLGLSIVGRRYWGELEWSRLYHAKHTN